METKGYHKVFFYGSQIFRWWLALLGITVYISVVYENDNFVSRKMILVAVIIRVIIFNCLGWRWCMPLFDMYGLGIPKLSMLSNDGMLSCIICHVVRQGCSRQRECMLLWTMFTSLQRMPSQATSRRPSAAGERSSHTNFNNTPKNTSSYSPRDKLLYRVTQQMDPSSTNISHVKQTDSTRWC